MDQHQAGQPFLPAGSATDPSSFYAAAVRLSFFSPLFKTTEKFLEKKKPRPLFSRWVAAAESSHDSTQIMSIKFDERRENIRELAS